MNKNTIYATLCIVINLIIGNITLLVIMPDTSAFYHLLISVLITAFYSNLFYSVSQNTTKISGWRLFSKAVMASLFCMLIACIFTSIANRLPHDDIFTAGLKGILPLFIFAIFIASPIWILLSFCNFLFLKKIENLPRDSASH